ncbi:MAG: glycosyl hydrolase, partial [Acidimicrobiia bacterium]
AEGATNVVWVWTPNAAGFKDKRSYTNDEPPAPHFYPGDEYVDWIAADGYNWGVYNRDQGDRWRHVIEIFDEFMVFARQRPKPIMIGEYGAQEQSKDPEAKAKWMKAAHEVFSSIWPRTQECQWCGAYSDVAALVYFDVHYGKHGDWRIMSSPGSQAAYDAAGDNPYFHQMGAIAWPPSANRPPPGQAPPVQPRPPDPEPKEQPAPEPEPEEAPVEDPPAEEPPAEEPKP